MIRVLYRLLLIILLLLFLLASMLVFVITTPTGTKVGIQTAITLLGKQLSVGMIQGRLLDSLDLREIAYQSSSFDLHINLIHLTWHPLSLIHKHLWIHDLTIESAKIQIKPVTPLLGPVKLTTPTTTNNFSWIPRVLSFSSQIEQLHVQDVVIYYPNQLPIKIKNLGFSGIKNEHREMHIDLSMESGNAQATLQGGLSDNWNLNYKIDIPTITTWIPALSGTAKLIGTLCGVETRPELNAMLLAKVFPRSVNAKEQESAIFQADINLHALALLKQAYPDITAEILLKKGQLDYKVLDQMMRFPFNGFLKTHLDERGLSSQLNLQLHNQKFIQSNLALPAYKISKPLSDQIMHASIQAQLNQSQVPGLNFAWLANPQGNLYANLQLAGTLGNPIIKGEATLQSKQLQLPKYGLQLQDLRLRASLQDQQRELLYNGSVRSGKGALQLQGKSVLQNNVFSSSFLVTGKQFLVSNTPKIQLAISPDLRIEDRKNGWYINGKITVPTASLKLSDLTKNIVLPPETVIVEKSGLIEQEKNSPIFTEVTLLLGDDVHLETSGLNTFVNGNLVIRDTPDTETLATGRLNLTKGSYDLEGQKLNVDQSAFIFTNSLISNPNLNIRATKTIQYTSTTTQTLASRENLKVGMQVTGTAENPIVTLFSDPAGWSQPDILSLILFGQPASMVSGANLPLLSMAARKLSPGTGGGFSQLNHQFQQLFGLSEFGIQSGLEKKVSGETAQTSSFVIGKYLSPRLYLNYSLSILNSANTVRLRYLLSKHWSIVTRASTLGSGADVVYSIEH